MGQLIWFCLTRRQEIKKKNDLVQIFDQQCRHLPSGCSSLWSYRHPRGGWRWHYAISWAWTTETIRQTILESKGSKNCFAIGVTPMREEGRTSLLKLKTTLVAEQPTDCQPDWVFVMMSSMPEHCRTKSPDDWPEDPDVPDGQTLDQDLHHGRRWFDSRTSRWYVILATDNHWLGCCCCCCCQKCKQNEITLDVSKQTVCTHVQAWCHSSANS